MFYSSPFYITQALGNNAFSFEKRESKKLFVPSLVKAKSFSQIELGSEIVFEDFDENGVLQSCKGLKNMYEFSLCFDGKNIPLYLFDNHNHALFFWYQALHDGFLKDFGNTVLHIDEHADTRVPEEIFSPLRKGVGGISQDELGKVFHYANFVANVGNYMIPAKEEGLVGEIFQIRDEASLEKDYDADILNLDLDFFTPRLDYIPYAKKKDFILRHIKKAKVITVSTSPFFIDQTLALKVFQDIFGEFILQ